MNYSGKMNLLRFKNACVVSVQGKTAKKKGIFIPIEDNHLFVSADEAGRTKGAYVDFMAWENQRPSPYGDTHSLRQSYPKEARDRMTEEEQKAVPYFGNMRPFEAKNAAAYAQPLYGAEAEDLGELPF